MKQCPDRVFELFIKFVRVYENKIEIGINYAVNTANNNEPITQKVFTETYTTERNYKGNKTKITTRTYDIYVVIQSCGYLFHGVLDTGLRMINSTIKTKKQALCY